MSNIGQLSMLFIPAILAFVFTVIIGKIGLPILKKLKAGQNIRTEGPESHASKTGTPTMGGWFFILSILVVSIGINFLNGSNSVSIWFYIASLVIYALIGFIDDFLNIVLKRNEGLTSIQKLALQFISVVILFIVFQSHFNHPELNIFGFILKLPLVVYIIFAAIWFVGFSNATNVTDGLDGLLSTTGSIAFAAFGIIAIIKGASDTAIFCFIVVGALVGFLVFNKYPAKVFMGDTGSLALGALLAAVSIELHAEALLLLVGIVFIIETASVMIQVSYFKYTKKKYGEGKRVFLMSPFHHHLELKGNHETKIVKILSFIGLLGAVLAIGIAYYIY